MKLRRELIRKQSDFLSLALRRIRNKMKRNEWMNEWMDDLKARTMDMNEWRNGRIQCQFQMEEILSLTDRLILFLEYLSSRSCLALAV